MSITYKTSFLCTVSLGEKNPHHLKEIYGQMNSSNHAMIGAIPHVTSEDMLRVKTACGHRFSLTIWREMQTISLLPPYTGYPGFFDVDTILRPVTQSKKYHEVALLKTLARTGLLLLFAVWSYERSGSPR